MIDPKNPDFLNTPASPQRARFAYAPADVHAAPDVSIVTPFYNEGPVFHETARSVLGQSFQQWEWIIVNDASTDPAALATLDVYRRSDPRIHVIDQPVNGGPSAARNAAFRLARAEHVVHLDSDNLLEPTAIEKWRWFLESFPEYAFVKGYTVGFGEQTYLSSHGFHDGAAFLQANHVDTTSMIRRRVHREVGGFDVSIREGLEDWEFWIRCADHGYWGGTVPEYLDWYRRRRAHVDRWKTWDGGEKEARFGADLRRRFPRLWQGAFPQVNIQEQPSNALVPDDLPCTNPLAKSARRLLLILPWLTMGGADKFALDVVEQLTARGWEITVATTLGSADPWHAAFARRTPDLFLMHRFVRLVDFPRFLRYLIQSRRPDAVLVSHSELGYQLLPYLRAHAPDVPFLDFCHIEEQWKNGGYPGMSATYGELLDVSLASSAHLKDWMVGRGADPDRVHVCYTNVDTDVWQPNADVRRTVRAELRIDDGQAVILYAGRVCAQKQPRVFAETVKRLSATGLRFTAIVAGDGPDFAWLERVVRRHGLPVLLLGAVPSERVNALMCAADIFFLPSEWEGIALSIFEAMASGVAIVGADVGGQRELVTPDCGVLIPRADPADEVEAYSAALADLIRNPEKRQRMATAARVRVQTAFTLTQMTDQMIAETDTAVEWHRTRPRSAPGLGLGHACATQAVEYARLARVADRLWNERSTAPSVGEPARPPGWRERLYAHGRRLYAPYYRRGVARGGAWYFPLAERLKATLLRAR